MYNEGGRVERTPYDPVAADEGGEDVWQDEKWARGDYAGCEFDPEEVRSPASDDGNDGAQRPVPRGGGEAAAAVIWLDM